MKLSPFLMTDRDRHLMDIQMSLEQDQLPVSTNSDQNPVLEQWESKQPRLLTNQRGGVTSIQGRLWGASIMLYPVTELHWKESQSDVLILTVMPMYITWKMGLTLQDGEGKNSSYKSVDVMYSPPVWSAAIHPALYRPKSPFNVIKTAESCSSRDSWICMYVCGCEDPVQNRDNNVKSGLKQPRQALWRVMIPPQATIWKCVVEQIWAYERSMYRW